MQENLKNSSGEQSFKEQRIRKITHLYYSRPDIQKAIFEFSKNREISPRYFEGFGKRPDSFQYKGDIFELVKKGATSFHCSEELWQDPLKITTGMTESQSNELRIGWDLLIDIDCKWFDYSKLAAKAIIGVLKDNGIKNLGLKFSGSKGWHILIPWKSFPKEINGVSSSNLFPELPRKIINYIRFQSEKKLKEMLPEDFEEQFKGVNIKRGIKCNRCSEIASQYVYAVFSCRKCGRKEYKKFHSKGQMKKYSCPECGAEFKIESQLTYHECHQCRINSKYNPDDFSQTIQEDLFDLMGLDIILVSPRHLFRMPYSLHEKTALASVVIDEQDIDGFQLKDASPMKISSEKIKNFSPVSAEEAEAEALVREALDWTKDLQIARGETEEKITGKYAEYKPVKLDNLSEQNFPPCIKNILKGISDGKKRALFALINLFRSVGMDKEKMENEIYEWNKKNNPPLKEGYIKSQLSWAYRKKPIMPPNCKEFYQGIAACQPDDLCLNKGIKNPVNYVVRRSISKRKGHRKSRTNGNSKDNFKKKN